MFVVVALAVKKTIKIVYPGMYSCNVDDNGADDHQLYTIIGVLSAVLSRAVSRLDLTRQLVYLLARNNNSRFSQVWRAALYRRERFPTVWVRGGYQLRNVRTTWVHPNKAIYLFFSSGGWGKVNHSSHFQVVSILIVSEMSCVNLTVFS